MLKLSLIVMLMAFPMSVISFQRPTTTPTSPIPVPVCQVLANLANYRGKVVEIQGEWIVDGLTADCTPLKTGNYSWLNAIFLDFPDYVT
jgi:hypothetical protein